MNFSKIMTKEINVIVTMCRSNGIGINGQLPWKLKEDMKFFEQITCQTEYKEKKNAVIMGRKTWESFPTRFKPLPQRVNIIISNTLICEESENMKIAHSIEEALLLAEENHVVEKIFIIGGSSIYKLVLESKKCDKIYITEVDEDFKCDVFFPNIPKQDFIFTQLNNKIYKENEIRFKFLVALKKIKTSLEEIRKENLMFIYAVFAMEMSRGIGKGSKLPWPKINKDLNHYINLAKSSPGFIHPISYYDNLDGNQGVPSNQDFSSSQDVLSNNNDICNQGLPSIKNFSKKTIILCGRLTYELLPPFPSNLLFVVTSNKEKLSNHLEVTMTTLNVEEAILNSYSFFKNKMAANVCILGGASVYKEAIDKKICQRLFVTMVKGSYDNDVIMPPFLHNYQKHKVTVTGEKDEEIIEENGVSFVFEEYKMIK